MADLVLSSSAQSSLLHVRPNLFLLNSSVASPIRSVRFLNRNGFHPLAFASGHRRLPLGAVVPSDSKKTITGTITANCVASGVKAVEVEPTIDYGGGGGIGGDKFGGGGGGRGDGNDDEGDSDEEESDGKKNTPLSMSQKLTLGYAFLVGVGGLMGYLKSGSQKSLLAGGLSAAVLMYVFTQLPTKPVLASTIGVVMAGALTWVMGTRYIGSKKIFPAGVVSIMSFIMTGGYIHGIMRSLH
ncbi:PREDICTED: protein FATTY ACID EXPORT 2, chloroplastic [Camelina sativa]|uniref:Protein FATTY ACID EXPORT 2, chloroplastic n=1 Tax=Camelina sativa TaxID=90675 RepID=A0ABM0TFW9_CAMSA|nr:PREDICTED: protein FATTY ACID EXPORT 2, chloroplastic [Camelina sativa]